MQDTEKAAERVKRLRSLIEYHSNLYYNADAPEIEVAHWFNDDRYLQRYIEIWLPIEKI